MDNTMKCGQMVVLVLTCLLVIMNLFYKTMPSVLSVDFIRDMELSATALSAISGATMLGFGLMQIPSGVLTDFLGGRKTLTLLFLLASLSVIAFSFTSSAPVAVGLRFATGIGIAVTVPGLALLARWYPGRSFAKANGIFLACGSLGPLLASSPLAYTVTAWGWRPVVLGCGLSSLLLAACVGKLIPATPPDVVGFKQEKLCIRAIVDNMKVVGSRKVFWVLAICMACGPGMGMAFTSLWWGPYLIQGCGMSQTQAGNVLTAVFLLAAPALPFIGWVYAGPLPKRRVLLRLLFGLSLLPMTGLILFSGSNAMLPHILIGAVFQYTVTGGVTVLYASMRELFPLRMVGTALGCLNTILPMTTMAVQYVVGLVLGNSADAAAGDFAPAYASAILVFAACSITGLAATFFIKDDCRSDGADCTAA